jgi:hypothetical protein
MVLIFMMRVFKLYRPPLEDDTPLDPVRVALGWLCIIIFIGCFSIVPVSFPMP